MSLPIYQDPIRNLMLLQTNWASQLNPVITNSLVNGILLQNIALKTGANVINHLLSRQMRGWILTDIDAAATVYRSAPMNTQTLTLTASAPANVNLWVF